MFAFDLPRSVIETQQALTSNGWIFAMDHVKRGMCVYDTKRILLPSWLLRREQSYQVYYYCHEMAHAIAGREANHGPVFMATLKDICPADVIHWEGTYKPRNALAAGIVHIASDF